MDRRPTDRAVRTRSQEGRRRVSWVPALLAASMVVSCASAPPPRPLSQAEREEERLDPQAQAVLAELAATSLDAPPPISEPDAIEQARRRYRELRPLSGRPEPVHAVLNRVAPGPGGHIRVRLYVPAAEGPLPVVVFFHGGGFVAGGLDTHDALSRALANRARAIVALVDYRLAPEHPFPAAVEDALAATRWLAEHAAEFGGDAQRLAVAGEDAGANLTAVVALLARDQAGPKLAFQGLVYPNTDATMRSASWSELGGKGYNLSIEEMRARLSWYLRGGGNPRDFRVSPLVAPDVASLPPALVVTAELDPLRDEGEAYAERLKKAGVPVTLRRYEGMIHDFLLMAGAVDAGAQLLDELGAALRRAFNPNAVEELPPLMTRLERQP